MSSRIHLDLTGPVQIANTLNTLLTTPSGDYVVSVTNPAADQAVGEVNRLRSELADHLSAEELTIFENQLKDQGQDDAKPPRYKEVKP